MPFLALILFTPLFLILGILFCLFPRAPRTTARRAFDAATLLVAAAGSVAGMRWAYTTANTDVGAMWKQIFAALVAYGVYIGVMTVALVARQRMIRTP